MADAILPTQMKASNEAVPSKEDQKINVYWKTVERPNKNNLTCEDNWMAGVDSGSNRKAILLQGIGPYKDRLRAPVRFLHDASDSKNASFPKADMIEYPADWTVFDPQKGNFICLYDAKRKLRMTWNRNGSDDPKTGKGPFVETFPE